MISYVVKDMETTPGDVLEQLTAAMHTNGMLDEYSEGAVVFHAHCAIVLQLPDPEWRERVERAAEDAGIPIEFVEQPE